MGNFRPSRGRILFEVLCALGIAASLAGAWQQTGASALLAAAAVALLYALIHLLDLSAKKAVPAAVQPVDEPVKAAPPVEAAAPEVDEPPPPKAPRKSGTRRPKTPKSKAAKPVAVEEPAVAELPVPEEVEPVVPFAPEEPVHAPVTQLFEPEPFVRQQRTVFGRKAG